MANIFQVATVRSKTPRMSHRFSLRFDGLNGIINLASQRLDTYKLPGTQENGNRYNHLSPALTATQATSDGPQAVADTLELSLMSVSLPSNEMETVEIARFHDTAKHISKFGAMADMEVSFYDYVNGSASAIMSVWHGMVGDRRTGAISYKNEYVLPLARLIEYGPVAPAESNPTPIAEHAVINLYPKSVNLGEHSYETAEVRKVQVTFAVDNVFPLYYKGTDYAVQNGGVAQTGSPLYTTGGALASQNI